MTFSTCPLRPNDTVSGRECDILYCRCGAANCRARNGLCAAGSRAEAPFQPPRVSAGSAPERTVRVTNQ